MDDKQKRLLLARERAGYRSARQAALSMGWTYPTYASHENGFRNFPQRVAERYARAFRVSPEFLMFGTNPPDWANHLKVQSMVELHAPLRSLRLFTDAEGDVLRSWLQHQQSGGPQFMITDPGNISLRSIALTVNSDEMRAKPPAAGEREVLPGDTAIIDIQRQQIRPGDVVALLVKGDPYVHLRKVVMHGVGRVSYLALNRDHGEFDTGDVVGRVMWVVAGM